MNTELSNDEPVADGYRLFADIRNKVANADEKGKGVIWLKQN